MVVFTYGVMGSGKSAKLIERYDQELNKDEVLILKLTNQKNLNTGFIKSRNGKSIPCHGRILQEKESAYKKIRGLIKNRDIKTIYIDEIQFLTKGQVKDIVKIAKQNSIDLWCYGLLHDDNNKLFEGSQELLRYTDKKIKLIGYCECGNIATTHTKFTDGDRVYYKAVCNKCKEKI